MTRPFARPFQARPWAHRLGDGTWGFYLRIQPHDPADIDLLAEALAPTPVGDMDDPDAPWAPVPPQARPASPPTPAQLADILCRHSFIADWHEKAEAVLVDIEFLSPPHADPTPDPETP